jgi:hypothetical protein
MLKSEVRAEDYRAKARSASAMAQACVLDRTREQHEFAASVWTKLAESEERRALGVREAPNTPATHSRTPPATRRISRPEGASNAQLSLARR